MRLSKKGFTLIELLVVIAILGILSVMVMGNIFTSQRKARDLQRKSDIRQIGQALELYYQDNGRYPAATAVNGGQIMGCGTNGDAECAWGNSSMQKTVGTEDVIYMALVPNDPRGGNYFYDTDPNGTYYQLYTRLENEEDRDIIKDGDGDVQVYGSTNCGSGTCSYGFSSTNITATENHDLEDD